MNDHDPAVYIEQIILAARKALSFVKGLSEADFLAHEVTQQACAMSLIIIGENGKRLLRKCPTFVSRHTSIPWHDMANMRNRIAHGYETLDFRVIWKAVTNDLPDLLMLLEPLLDELDRANPPSEPMANGDV